MSRNAVAVGAGHFCGCGPDRAEQTQGDYDVAWTIPAPINTLCVAPTARQLPPNLNSPKPVSGIQHRALNRWRPPSTRI